MAGPGHRERPAARAGGATAGLGAGRHGHLHRAPGGRRSRRGAPRSGGPGRRAVRRREAAGVLLPVPGDDEALRVVAAVGPRGADAEGVRVPLADGLLREAHRSGVPALVPDIDFQRLAGCRARRSRPSSASDYGPALLIPRGRAAVARHAGGDAAPRPATRSSRSCSTSPRRSPPRRRWRWNWSAASSASGGCRSRPTATASPATCTTTSSSGSSPRPWRWTGSAAPWRPSRPDAGPAPGRAGGRARRHDLPHPDVDLRAAAPGRLPRGRAAPAGRGGALGGGRPRPASGPAGARRGGGPARRARARRRRHGARAGDQRRPARPCRAGHRHRDRRPTSSACR